MVNVVTCNSKEEQGQMSYIQRHILNLWLKPFKALSLNLKAFPLPRKQGPSETVFISSCFLTFYKIQLSISYTEMVTNDQSLFLRLVQEESLSWTWQSPGPPATQFPSKVR